MQLTPNPYDLKLKLICDENIDRLREYLRTGSCFPMAIEISPTNRCNLECSWCISKQYHRNDTLDWGVLVKFLGDYKELGGKSVTWSGGGEPTVYPQFAMAVETASILGLDQGLMTNGLFGNKSLEVTGEIIQWVRVSLDTVNNERYKQMKGRDALGKVLKNIERLAKCPTKLIVNMNLARVNEDEVLDVATVAKNLGAKGFQLRPVLPIPDDSTYYIPDNLDEIIAELKGLETPDFFCNISYDKFNELGKPREYKSCTYHNFLCVLNANGDLSVCMYKLYEDEFTFGNIYVQDVGEIWSSRRRKQVIKLCTDMDFSTCQVCCKGHELNTFLYYIEVADGMKDRRFL